MSLTIYHNPRCSKSRETLRIIDDSGTGHEIVEYLQNPPSAATIVQIAALLELPVSALLRTGEPAWREAQDALDTQDERALAEWIVANPSALQRPLVVDEASGRAVIGRPPQNVLELLTS